MKGLYGKYMVINLEKWVIEEPPIFVLKPRHDPHARKAMLTYAESCESDNPELAHDIRELVRVQEDLS